MVLARFLTISLWLSLLLAVAAPASAQASRLQALEPTDSRPAPSVRNPSVVYFPETGHTLGYVFRTYWLSRGGLAQFGYPLTEEFDELNPEDGKVYTVQYFERARFEYHPEFRDTPYEVELGLLGKQFVGQQEFAFSAPFTSNRQRTYFPETGHSLSYGFKTYWENRGGLAIYGYPISEEIIEGGYTVQYFERARFEYHPEFRGSPYEVLLGLLGNTALEKTGRRLPQAFRVEASPTTVVQGRTVQVVVLGDTGTTLRSALDGTALTFVPGGDRRRVAVAPILSSAPLTAQALKTEIIDESGVVRRFEQTIGVARGQFEQQYLPVSDAVTATLGTAEEQRRERERVYSFYGQVTPEKLWNGKFSWPVLGPITTQFGARRTYPGGATEFHDAIDIGIPDRTPIRASQRGRVVMAEFGKVRGNLVIIDHGLGVHTGYYHNSVLQVKVGDIVNAGDVIALAGTTGLSTGVHCHWDVRIGLIGVDPMEWMNREFN